MPRLGHGQWILEGLKTPCHNAGPDDERRELHDGTRHPQHPAAGRSASRRGPHL